MRVVAASLAVIIVASVMALWLAQRRLIYYPDARRADTTGWPGQAVTLRTADGLELNAWYLPPEGQDKEASVLVCNGNAGNFGDRLPLASALSREGLGVLLFDYRGYGGNPGAPSEQGLAKDVDAAWQWLAQHHADRRHIYYGESIGSAVATGLAQRHPPAALVLRSPFSRLADVANAQMHLPVGWLLRDRYEIAPVVRHLDDVPLLVISAEMDELIPPDLSRQVYEAAGGPKRLVEVAGAGHNAAALLDSEQMVDEIIDLIETSA